MRPRNGRYAVTKLRLKPTSEASLLGRAAAQAAAPKPWLAGQIRQLRAHLAGQARLATTLATPVLLCVAAVTARVIVGGHITDDAYITMRYSRNLSASGAMSYAEAIRVIEWATVNDVTTAISAPKGARCSRRPS